MFMLANPKSYIPELLLNSGVTGHNDSRHELPIGISSYSGKLMTFLAVTEFSYTSAMF